MLAHHIMIHRRLYRAPEVQLGVQYPVKCDWEAASANCLLQACNPHIVLPEQAPLIQMTGQQASITGCAIVLCAK